MLHLIRFLNIENLSHPIIYIYKHKLISTY